ncbi:hypothetical protein GRI39_11095 [Altererythrobacter indicus]|uniref:PPM-type phosphatase domain-containing protein n=1 Tax=Altericroceibacterium indicum TaxID=374177 RepID=A0A845AC61_9SPHN|nr:hypothetical protein [Altericroceibacterium indicum]
MLKIVLAASDGPGEINEDKVGFCGNAAWVIDGATGVGAGLLPEPSDAAWLAQAASDALTIVLSQQPESSTRDVLREVMARCRSELYRQSIRPVGPDDHLPSAAFAMVRIMDGYAELTTLADCRVVAHNEAGEAQLLGSSALDAIEGRTIELAAKLLRGNPSISTQDLKAQLLPHLQGNRGLMNQPHGYWVLGTDPAAADHLWQQRIPLSAGRRFAIASDGFLRLIELFGAASAADLLAISSELEWSRWLAELRLLERKEESRLSFPRVKPEDDASLIICEWEGEI